MKLFRFALLLLTFSAPLMRSPLRAQAAPAQDDGPAVAKGDYSRTHTLDNDAILKMHAAGLSDDLLVQTIQLQPGRYQTGPDDLIALKQAGLSDRVLSAMQTHGTGLQTRASRAPAVSPAPLAPGIDEIGVYYKDHDGQWIPLKTERVQFKSSGWLKNAATDGLIKQDMNGTVDDQRSPLHLARGVEILIYAPPGTQAEEYDLLRLEEHAHSRSFRVKTGGLFHSSTGAERDEIEFHPVKIAPQMYTFTMPRDIEFGEYGVLPPGSSNQPGLANAGKIFTFSLRE